MTSKTRERKRLKKVETALQRLEQENKELQDRVEELEGRANGTITITSPQFPLVPYEPYRAPYVSPNTNPYPWWGGGVVYTSRCKDGCVFPTHQVGQLSCMKCGALGPPPMTFTCGTLSSVGSSAVLVSDELYTH